MSFSDWYEHTEHKAINNFLNLTNLSILSNNSKAISNNHSNTYHCLLNKILDACTCSYQFSTKQIHLSWEMPLCDSADYDAQNIHKTYWETQL